jgi:primosomal protein N' (replication factor Y)
MVYKVIVDISSAEVDKFYDYSCPFAVEVGSRVKVPFGHREIEGFVIGTKESSHRETKDIVKVLDDEAVILPEMLALADELVKTNLRYIDCLRLFIPAKLRGGRVKALKRNFLSINDQIDLDVAIAGLRKNAVGQISLVERLLGGGEFETEILKEFSPSTVTSLVEKGIVLKTSEETPRIPECMDVESKEICLTAEQKNAVDTIVGAGGSYLLHGVTGSGKTEIYMSIIEKMLKIGKTAIMLVPEISLTPQMLGVFRLRFGDKVSVLHSGLSDGERYDEWKRLRQGKASIALGARSAIFAPLKNIGAIIIDEEHDGSYQSESNPRYFTTEIAQFRAKFNNASLVLGSATPSLESYLKAEEGEYKLITLLNRINKREMPPIEVVDMKKEIKNGNFGTFSRELLSALEEVLGKGEQAMLFLNRRGYASFLRCRACGYVANCSDCDVSLTYHKADETLKCHYCGKQYHAINECPKCEFKGIKEGKTGTQKIAVELNEIFPKAKILRMDFDTTATKNSYLNILQSFKQKKADILIGTQMIAKGHDFPLVTLVGIIDADQSLHHSDYRAGEKTFQLVTQVAGRAGRDEKEGRVIMQTYSPNHFVYRFATKYDYRGFFLKEANSREVTKFPPYSTIVKILALSKDENAAMTAAREIYRNLLELKKEIDDKIIRVQVMRSPIKRIENNFRFQVLLYLKKQNEGSARQEILAKIYENAKTNVKNVSVFAELNPKQFY